MHHHFIKAGFDAAFLSLAVGVATEHLPLILGLPSFIYATIQLVEWILSKIKK